MVLHEKESYEWAGNYGAHGINFQKDLAFTLFVGASLNRCEFKLATEVNGAGRFDDVVLSIGNHMLFFQSKHHGSSNEAMIEDGDLFPKGQMKNTEFALPLYMQSFLEIEGHQNFKEYQKQYIIFTK